MKVICINNTYYPVSLKVGKIYNIERENEVSYIIVDENQEEVSYPKKLFEVQKNL